MRILYIVHQYPPEYIGGTELYTQSLAQAFTRNGDEVAVFYRRSAEGQGIAEEQRANVLTYAVWNGKVTPTRRFLAFYGDNFITQAFKKVIESFRPHLVHIQHLMGMPISITTQLQQYKIPYFITLHDYWWLCPNAQLLTNYDNSLCDGPSKLHLNCARCALARSGYPNLWAVVPTLAPLLTWRDHKLRQTLSAAKMIIAPSPFVRSWYASHRIPKNHIQVIPHGIAPPPDILSSYTIKPPIRFTYIGGLSWQKGVHILIEAFRGVRGPAELWIAGDEQADPPYVISLKERASPNVHFLGRLSHKGVWELLQQVHAVVIPSLWHETFSLIAHEALAAQRPVIASQVGALGDAIRDGENGILLPPGDLSLWQQTLQRLVDTPHLLTKLRSKVYLPSSLEAHVSAIQHLYQRVQSEAT